MIRYRYVASSLENLTCASWWKSKECWCTCLYTNPWLENMTENCWKQPVNYGRDIRELIKGNQTDDWKVYINGSLYKRTLQTWRGIGIACERERPAITQFPKLLSLGSSVSWWQFFLVQSCVCVCVSIPIRTYIYWFDGPGLCENLKMATILFCVFWNNVLVLEKLWEQILI